MANAVLAWQLSFPDRQRLLLGAVPKQKYFAFLHKFLCVTLSLWHTEAVFPF